jgi:hypothetical protein
VPQFLHHGERETNDTVEIDPGVTQKPVFWRFGIVISVGRDFEVLVGSTRCGGRATQITVERSSIRWATSRSADAARIAYVAGDVRLGIGRI